MARALFTIAKPWKQRLPLLSNDGKSKTQLSTWWDSLKREGYWLDLRWKLADIMQMKYLLECAGFVLPPKMIQCDLESGLNQSVLVSGSRFWPLLFVLSASPGDPQQGIYPCVTDCFVPEKSICSNPNP